MRKILLAVVTVFLAGLIVRGLFFPGGQGSPPDEDRGSMRANRDGTPGMKVP